MPKRLLTPFRSEWLGFFFKISSGHAILSRRGFLSDISLPTWRKADYAHAIEDRECRRSALWIQNAACDHDDGCVCDADERAVQHQPTSRCTWSVEKPVSQQSLSLRPFSRFGSATTMDTNTATASRGGSTNIGDCRIECLDDQS